MLIKERLEMKKYRIKIVRKVNHLIRFIDRLKKYDNKKAFNDYLKRKEIRL